LVGSILTSVCTAGSTAGVAITALALSNKRIDRVEASLDKINTTLMLSETGRARAHGLHQDQ
jgi:hypothetical protein